MTVPSRCCCTAPSLEADVSLARCWATIGYHCSPCGRSQGQADGLVVPPPRCLSCVGNRYATSFRTGFKCAAARQTQPRIGPRYNSVYFKSPLPRPQLNPILYKGFTITARTFQVHGSGRWTLDLLIGRNTDLRAFSGPRTYPTEESAITGCCEFGQRIIDGRVRNCSVDDLS